MAKYSFKVKNKVVAAYLKAESKYWIMQIITTYLTGLYGSIADERSAQIAISLLLPERLKEQYCFLSQRAVFCLKVVEVCKYEL